MISNNLVVQNNKMRVSIINPSAEQMENIRENLTVLYYDNTSITVLLENEDDIIELGDSLDSEIEFARMSLSSLLDGEIIIYL